MRTAGSGPVGQSGSASVRRTAPGTSNAAGLSTSKGNAPNTIGAAPERSAACAALHVADSAACTPSATRVPVGPHSANGGSAMLTRVRLPAGWPVNPSAASCRTPCSNPHTAIEAGEHPEAAALDERQLDPAGDHRAGEVAVAHEHHVARGHVL